MTDSLRDKIAAVLVGALVGQAEQRGDYASYDFDPNDLQRELVHLYSSIDPFSLADAVIRELEADYVLVPKSRTLARNAFKYGEHYGI